VGEYGEPLNKGRYWLNYSVRWGEIGEKFTVGTRLQPEQLLERQLDRDPPLSFRTAALRLRC
jgi:hypothetical protein